MGRACAVALALVALAAAAAPAAAQNSTFGETQLNGTGPVYKKQDSLDPVRTIPVVARELRVQLLRGCRIRWLL